MKRRDFLKILGIGSLVGVGAGTTKKLFFTNQDDLNSRFLDEVDPSVVLNDNIDLIPRDGEISIKTNGLNLSDKLIEKNKFYYKDFDDDIYLDEAEFAILKSCLKRITAVQNHVGYGNFNLLGFDDMLFIGRNYSSVGSFSKAEVSFLEELYYRDAANYGFMGNKQFDKMTHTVSKKDVIKVPRTGHYLYRGEALSLYEKIRKDIGDDVFLTSGIRGVSKQFHLFIAKSVETNGNLARASRSLAPAGYSYHGISDFDVGQVGYGFKNFTDDFEKSPVFKKLIRSGYVDIRYGKGNREGVRFEPWHIQVIS